MQRRIFLSRSLTLCAALPVLRLDLQPHMPEWLVTLVKQNDLGVASLLNYQVKDENSENLGGLRDSFDILNPHSTAALVQWGTCAVFSPKSRFYQSEELLSAMNLAVMYLLKTQHSDGTIDLLSTNFHSTPDTGFLVKRLAIAYSLLKKSAAPGAGKVMDNLKTFLLRCGEALIVGGIHTPNHRWVVSAVLARLNQLWPDPKYAARAEQWLSEHIDLDADGQYNEKSTFIYSSLSDRLLITISNSFKKTGLLQYVRKNLDMTMYYVHPNGEIVTDASGRQDKAVVGTLENYYYPYRYLAVYDKNGQYAAMCTMIEKTAGLKIAGYLDYLLDDPALWAELPVAKPVPVNFVKAFPNSGLVRIRRDQWDATLIANNPVWLTFMKGSAVLQGIRFASSFFGKGQFVSEKLDADGPGWKLTQKLEGPYYQPYPKDYIPTDGDWEKMPRYFRPQSEVQKLETIISIKEIEHGMEITIKTRGTERVPAALELIFRPGGTLHSVSKLDQTKDTWLLGDTMGTYTLNGDQISFGPGKALHKNVALRGALPPMDAPTVFITGFTPFSHTIRLT
ncbi:hypothetical protein [Dyadobacter sandarakinus]|uniref:Heparinase II/III-like protein n=1 Tax=Dyadobacter sandarakinus TaxID=2747268 RepID=A0ABX7ICN7_9BACT|nr:hypothetical protein [Dyadobacter sandarakinus]QRR03881.1 hypothetical protein HWI92_24700 [Dyadobacter sandarakinus]